MSFSIYPVGASDVNVLVREVEYPAYQNNPLHVLMFPGSDKQDKQKEEEIQWMVDGLLETILGNNETLRMACREDRSPVGFIGWINDQKKFARVVDKKDHEKQGHSWHPTTMDVESWLHVSRRLREERQRVLQKYEGNGVCRITFMAVNPDYQRQGVGSMLMQLVCDEADESNLDAFVMSSPAGIRLYSKFGFQAVGRVQTSHGEFTSMLRIARSPLV